MEKRQSPINSRTFHILWFAVALLVASSVACRAGTEAEEPATTETTTTEVPGTGNFSRIPFRVSVGVRPGYDDNVYTSHTDRHGSGFLSSSLDLQYDFGDARTKLSLDAGGGYTWYFDRPGDRDYDVSAYLGLSLTHRATPRLTLSATVYAAYLTEPNFGFFAGANRRVGNYFYTLDKFSVAYLWAPRFSTTTSYTIGSIHYDDAAVGAFENRIEHTFAQEFKFLWLPTTSLVGEYRFGIVDYEDLNARDSTTHYLLAGVDHSFSARLNASLRAGAEFRSYEDERDRSAPYVEGTVNYSLTRQSSISWTSRYGIEEPDVPGSPSRTTFRTGLQLKYALSSRISTTVAAYYRHDDNEGVDTPTVFSPSFTEDSFDLALAVRYAINRNFFAEVGYSHTEVVSDITLREYSRNRFFGGLVLTF